MGKNTFELPDGVFFEGQGDVVTLDNAILFGHGPRSSPEAGEYIRRMLLPTRQVVYLELTGNDFYHLDTCCMALRGTDKQGLMYYPKAFTKESVQKIEDLGGVDRLAISPDAAKTFACNSVFVNNVVLLNVPFNYSEEAFELSAAGEFLGEMREDIRYADMVRRLPSYPLIINFLRKFGYKIIPVYTSEFAKSGAGVRCLTFFVD